MVANDPGLCDRNAEGLRQNGYNVDFASDGDAGWGKLQINHYDLLITENDLPGMTGVGLVKKLRAACMPLPIVLTIETLPSWRSAEYPWILTAAKLFKPYSFEDLLGLVRNVLPASGLVRVKLAPAANQNQTTSARLPLG